MSALGKFSFLVVGLTSIACIGGAEIRDLSLADSATVIRNTEYEVIETVSGETSQFFLFGAIPITPPLNPNLALSKAVSKAEAGTSIISLKQVHETRLYFPLGTVSVLRIEGLLVGPKTKEKIK
ncbi:hypothetical protein [Leptospira sarikeiensis]|uniref:Uncharacterized protein n=1 Tax=Leptospira sarikeiensis TaxID=2484943 RepID=A0A4R9K355_9LEPT|nr:hypothetical protein [Leptospira sarikeiensis]TGL60479.1 hypothetical protein EHQ64_11605 [Leptospira sarikeiensis]